MSCHVRYAPEFWADYDAAIRYLVIELGNPDAARVVEEELDRAVERVRAYPFSMQPYLSAKRRGETYRAVDVKNFFAFYVIRGETVEFRRFLHAASDLRARLS